MVRLVVWPDASLSAAVWFFAVDTATSKAEHQAASRNNNGPKCLVRRLKALH